MSTFSTVKHTEIKNPYLSFEGRLSEGVTYNPSNNTLLWVDIIAGKLHRVRLGLESTTHEEIVIPDEKIGVIYLVKDFDDLVYLGARHGIASYDFITGQFEYVIKYPAEASHLRSNDGNVAPTGKAIYAGLMGDFDIGPVPDGKLYNIDTTTGQFHTVEGQVLIPNGINWSYDFKHLFWTSSLEFTIYKYDYDVKTNTASNKTKFIDMRDAYPQPQFPSPEPDGFAITETNHIFTAVWGTNSVAHFNEVGELVEVFTFPAQRVSCVGFGGPDLDEVFVTTANLHLDQPDKLNEDPEDLGGALFRFKVEGQKGLLRPKLTEPIAKQ